MSDFSIPSEWLNVEFEKLNSYKSANINPLSFPDETFELYSVPIFPSKKPEIIQGSEIGSSKIIVDKDDVLICKINPRINRVWVVSKFTDFQKIASSEWVVFRQNSVIPKFYSFYFQSSEFRNLLCLDVTGVGGSLTRAQPKNIVKYKVPLPPKAEQEKIAALLDSHLMQVENIKDRLNAIIPILKKFRQSVLADAVSGRLTEEWRRINNIPNWKEVEWFDITTKQKDAFKRGPFS